MVVALEQAEIGDWKKGKTGNSLFIVCHFITRIVCDAPALPMQK